MVAVTVVSRLGRASSLKFRRRRTLVARADRGNSPVVLILEKISVPTARRLLVVVGQGTSSEGARATVSLARALVFD